MGSVRPAIAAAAACLFAASVVTAQPSAPANYHSRKFDLSSEAREPLKALQRAVLQKDEAAYPAALAAAQAAVKTTDDRFVVAKLTLQHADQIGDDAARLAAYQAVLASGGADAGETGAIEHNMGLLAAHAGNWPLVESALDPVVRADPADVDDRINLARAKMELKKYAEALPLLQQAIKLQETAGGQVPEGWYRNALGIATALHNDSVAAQMTQRLRRLQDHH